MNDLIPYIFSTANFQSHICFCPGGILLHTAIAILVVKHHFALSSDSCLKRYGIKKVNKIAFRACLAMPDPEIPLKS